MPVQEIRAFNRFYTNLIGALDYSKHLYTPYTLTEARILYELAHGTRLDAADLRGALSLDAGHLSRLLLKFEQNGLVTREQSAEDARRQRITLTTRGREAAALLEERSSASVDTLLGKVPPADRARLTEAMRTVRGVLGEALEAPEGREGGRDGGREEEPAESSRVRLRPAGPGDLGWVVQRHGALYAREYGFDVTFEALVARILADFGEAHDPERERLWIAELDGAAAGSVMCVRDGSSPSTARLRLLLVEPAARGHGIGDRLVRQCVDFARETGHDRLVLWTNDVLGAARRLYQQAGFVLDEEKPHRSYGRELVGQDWHLML